MQNRTTTVNYQGKLTNVVTLFQAQNEPDETADVEAE